MNSGKKGGLSPNLRARAEAGLAYLELLIAVSVLATLGFSVYRIGYGASDQLVLSEIARQTARAGSRLSGSQLAGDGIHRIICVAHRLATTAGFESENLEIDLEFLEQEVELGNGNDKTIYLIRVAIGRHVAGGVAPSLIEIATGRAESLYRTSVDYYGEVSHLKEQLSEFDGDCKDS